MAFDPKPSTWLGAGLTLVGHVLGLNTNDASTNKLLTRITDADADPTTGDIRKLAYALCEMLYAAKLSIDTPDLPSRMTIQAANGTADSGRIRRTFTLTFILDAEETPVSDEPA